MSSAGKYYVVYWYPTIFHREKQRQAKVDFGFVDISDKSTLPLRLKKEEKGKNLQYTLRFLNTEKEITLDLTHEKERKNGFTTYSYNRIAFRKELREGIKGELIAALKENTHPIPEGYLETALENYKDDVLDKLIDKIFISCYHNAKDLYHKHEIQDSSDGRLEVYLKNSDTGKYLTSEPDISTPNHEVIRFFIEQYETLFYNYAHSVSDQYSLVNQKLSKYFSLNINNKSPKTPKEAISILRELDGLVAPLKNTLDISEDDKILPTLPIDEFKKSIEQQVNAELTEELQWYEKHINGTGHEDYSGYSLEELKEEIWKQNTDILDYLVGYLKSLQDMCGNALTEYNYCKSLLESKYNTEYKYDLQLTPDEVSNLGKEENISDELTAKDSHRKKAFNIRNSIRYIVEVRSKCDVWESDITRYLVQTVNRMQQTTDASIKQSEKIGELSLKLGKRSVILGLVSIFLAVLSIILGVWSVVLAHKSAVVDSCAATPVCVEK